MEIPQPFILASSSSARKRVLDQQGIHYIAIESGLDEASFIESDPIRRAALLAREKAISVAKKYPEAWVCGCDTVLLTATHELLEKPLDAADAKRMMRLQSGQCTTIYTGMCLSTPSSQLVEHSAEARMFFRVLTEDDIQWWFTTQDWAGAAGAFRSTGREKLLSAYQGDPTLLDGFSIEFFLNLLQEADPSSDVGS